MLWSELYVTHHSSQGGAAVANAGFPGNLPVF